MRGTFKSYGSGGTRCVLLAAQQHRVHALSQTKTSKLRRISPSFPLLVDLISCLLNRNPRHRPRTAGIIPPPLPPSRTSPPAHPSSVQPHACLIPPLLFFSACAGPPLHQPAAAAPPALPAPPIQRVHQPFSCGSGTSPPPPPLHLLPPTPSPKLPLLFANCFCLVQPHSSRVSGYRAAAARVSLLPRLHVQLRCPPPPPSRHHRAFPFHQNRRCMRRFHPLERR